MKSSEDGGKEEQSKTRGKRNRGGAAGKACNDVTLTPTLSRSTGRGSGMPASPWGAHCVWYGHVHSCRYCRDQRVRRRGGAAVGSGASLVHFGLRGRGIVGGAEIDRAISGSLAVAG